MTMLQTGMQRAWDEMKSRDDSQDWADTALESEVLVYDRNLVPNGPHEFKCRSLKSALTYIWELAKLRRHEAPGWGPDPIPDIEFKRLDGWNLKLTFTGPVSAEIDLILQ